MNYQPIFVDEDIRKAETLPAWFYQSSEVFELQKSKLFEKTWHWIGDHHMVPLEEYAAPQSLLDGYLSEPLLILRNKQNQLLCLSNVCTHRGNILVHHPGKYKKINCLYHGRRFKTDGVMEFMPEFQEALNFPRPCDNLANYPLVNWKGHLFTGINPSFDFGVVTDELEKLVGFLPIEDFQFRAELSKDYLVNANWALYCDNYLEGFHIPFVHPDLNASLNYGDYDTRIFEYFNLQVGIGNPGEDCFILPEHHPDKGKNVAAYYFWIFPNLMLNFYPWGLSINIVKPLAADKCKVSFLTYVGDENKLNKGAGALLDKVEREDEFVVEGVQKGLKSRKYERGRYSPKMEKGVHHFHSLLTDFMKR